MSGCLLSFRRSGLEATLRRGRQGRGDTEMKGPSDSLVGGWSGKYLLWLSPEDPVRMSKSEATVTTAAGGQFLVITYTWSEADKAHDGVLLVRLADEPGTTDMVWIDSFHTMGGFMQFAGNKTDDGSIGGATKWSVGEGPDWGWRIVVSSGGPDDLVVRMYIATPTGEESPAVESQYVRQTSPTG